MGISYGQYTYHYKVEIDLEDIVDRIAGKIGHMDDGYCWEVDGDKPIISAKHTTGYKHWYYRQTLESPEENDMELIMVDGVSFSLESFDIAMAASTKALISFLLDIASTFIRHLLVHNEPSPQHLVSSDSIIYYIF